MSDVIQENLSRARAFSDAVYAKGIALRNDGLDKVGVKPEDLEKLDAVPLIASFVSLVANLALLIAMSNNSWITATALSAGQPFTAYLSLTSVKFGTPSDPDADNKFFCANAGSCSLGKLCDAQDDAATFPNGLPKNTPAEAWCQAAHAGSVAASLLWFGLLPGLAATGFTFLFAAKNIASVSAIILKVEELGFRTEWQKWAVAGCWGLLWVFMFVALALYASLVPDSLGWGTTKLDASFGLLRFDFVIVSIFGAILVSNLFYLWNADNVIEGWMEFTEAKLLSCKKFLYLELMLQAVLYLFLCISYVDWSALLIVLAAFYLDQKNKNFLLMYLVLVTVSVLFDIIKFAGLPSFDKMTSGEGFGATLWIFIFLLKPIIVGTIYGYEKYEKEDAVGGNAWTQLEVGDRNDEIAE